MRAQLATEATSLTDCVMDAQSIMAEAERYLAQAHATLRRLAAACERAELLAMGEPSPLKAA